MSKNDQYKGAALITGAAKRIGKEISLFLSSYGYKVIIHYHQSKRDAQSLERQIKKNGQQCSIIQGDLTNEKQAAQLIGKAVQQYPDLNLLINNASTFKPSSFKASSPDTLYENLKVHLIAPYILMQQLNKVCRKGNIINILDTHITDNKTKHFDYLLTKKALFNLTQMAAVELSPNIRVNAVAPGLILPPVHKKDSYLNQRAKGIPMRKKGDPSGITQSIQFILENAFVTGQILFNDGGEHLL